jgi:dipeptidyl aminopeptidase/acylaminoacyl peptidase
MHPHRALVFVSLLLLASEPIQAQAPAPQRNHDITIDDYFTQADIFQIAAAPNLLYVAYTEGRWLKATDDRKTDLWLVDTIKRTPRRLTFDRANDRSPQWAPDSKTIYFAGNRKRADEKNAPYNGKTQVWRIGIGGGEPVAVTRVPGGIADFRLAGDGKSLFYITHGDAVTGPFQNLRKEFKHIQYGHGIDKHSQVWKLDLQSFRAEKIVDDKRYIHEMAVSPDGRRLAMITAPDDKVVSFEGKSRVDIYDFAKKKITPLPDKVFRADAPSPYAWLDKLAWSEDGKAVAFNAVFDGYPAQIVVAKWKDNNPEVFNLPRPSGIAVKGYGSPLQWRGEKHDLCFLGEEKGRVRLYCAKGVGEKDPQFEILTPGNVVVEGFSFALFEGFGKDIGAAVVMASPTQLPDIFNVSDGKLTQLTKVNPQADSWKMPKISVVSWKGANGDPVEGILELPPDYKKGQRVPLMLAIHGGPTTASYFKQEYWIYGRTLWPARGIAVLCPNYRGSTGYGDKFVTDLIGRENDIEVEDMLKGIDALVERGIADPNKIGVSGWSNGGYLTNCLIAKSTRFRAAISGAGIVDAIMEFASNDEPAYAIAFKQGLPWTKPEKYHKASTTYHLDKIKTPTLIHVGGNDERCPPGHSRLLYRALKEYVHVPTELCVYPGEGHGIMTYKNRRAKLSWDIAWLDRYLLGKGK